MPTDNKPIKNKMGVNILPIKEDVKNAIFAPGHKLRLVTYSPLKGKHKVDSGITIKGHEVDSQDFNNDSHWTKMPLSNEIGLPLKFKMGPGKPGKPSYYCEYENMFAQLMTLKKNEKYYPKNAHLKPYYGDITVVRVDGKALSSKQVHAVWDLVHFQLCTMKALQDGKLLPHAYTRAYEERENWRFLDRAHRLANVELPEPDDPKFVRFDDEACWVADRKYVFELLRENWVDKNKFMEFWTPWRNGMVEDGHEDYAEEHLKCPVQKDSVCPTQ